MVSSWMRMMIQSNSYVPYDNIKWTLQPRVLPSLVGMRSRKNDDKCIDETDGC